MMLHLIRAVDDYEPGVSPRALALRLVVSVFSASLYLIVFGIVLGREVTAIEGIVPGLIIFNMAADAIANAASAIFSSKLSGTAFEILSHRISFARLILHYVATPTAATALIGLFVLGVSRAFVDFTIVHPWYTALVFLTVSANFGICGFLLGIWAEQWETLYLAIPLVVTPLVFLCGCF
jgi:ABC-2 type transport system permease protein